MERQRRVIEELKANIIVIVIPTLNLLNRNEKNIIIYYNYI